MSWSNKPSCLSLTNDVIRTLTGFILDYPGQLWLRIVGLLGGGRGEAAGEEEAAGAASPLVAVVQRQQQLRAVPRRPQQQPEAVLAAAGALHPRHSPVVLNLQYMFKFKQIDKI